MAYKVKEPIAAARRVLKALAARRALVPLVDSTPTMLAKAS